MQRHHNKASSHRAKRAPPPCARPRHGQIWRKECHLQLITNPPTTNIYHWLNERSLPGLPCRQPLPYARWSFLMRPSMRSHNLDWSCGNGGSASSTERSAGREFNRDLSSSRTAREGSGQNSGLYGVLTGSPPYSGLFTSTSDIFHKTVGVALWTSMVLSVPSPSDATESKCAAVIAAAVFIDDDPSGISRNLEVMQGIFDVVGWGSCGKVAARLGGALPVRLAR